MIRNKMNSVKATIHFPVLGASILYRFKILTFLAWQYSLSVTIPKIKAGSFSLGGIFKLRSFKLSPCTKYKQDASWIIPY